MNRPLKRLGFLTIGLFDPADPAAGHESTLQIIELGEQLGFDSAWLRHRHLQYGISSPIAVMAAATQRTSRIELGTAVTPLGLENPFRLAEDLGTVDVLSAVNGVGRINPGVSVGIPMNYEALKEHLYPDTHDVEDFTYARVERLLHNLAGKPVSTFEGTRGVETFSRSIQPHSPGLVDRVWYGGGSTRSVTWAAEHGLNLLTSSVIDAEGDDFATIQRTQIDLFRSLHAEGEAARVSQGLVVIPTDSATPEQVAKYQTYAAARLPRTRQPQQLGPHKRAFFAPDIVGTSEQIAEQLVAHAGFQVVEEVAFALPFSFEHADYLQILTDMATRLGPLLGWQPAG